MHLSITATSVAVTTVSLFGVNPQSGLFVNVVNIIFFSKHVHLDDPYFPVPAVHAFEAIIVLEVVFHGSLQSVREAYVVNSILCAAKMPMRNTINWNINGGGGGCFARGQQKPVEMQN